MAREEPEEVELLRRQSDLDAVLAYLARLGVEHDVTEAELLRRDDTCLCPAEHASHTRCELARRERLRDVIVGTELEADDAICFLAAGGEHDHRQLRARSDPAAQVEAVRPGKHHVEDDEIEPLSLDEPTCIVTVARLECRVPLALEVANDDVTHDRLVVNDENGGHALDGAFRLLTHG